MWAGDNDMSDDGKSVRLYQPILYGAAKNRELGDTVSRIGGSAADDHWAVCATCQDSLFLLAQLYVPEPHKRAYQIFGCNRLTCIQGLFPSHSEDQDDGKNGGRKNNMLCYGGGGVVVCRRWNITETKEIEMADHQKQKADTTAPSTRTSTAAADWVVDGDETNASERGVSQHARNEWAVSEDDGNNNAGSSGLLMDDLEEKLAAMETRKAMAIPNPKLSTPGAIQDHGGSTTLEVASTPTMKRNCFPCFVLHSLQEPATVRNFQQVDPDDVGLGNFGRNGSRRDDAKIQQMLAQYMQEEDDEELLTMLRGESKGNSSSTTTTNSAINSGERDERLSATDRALLQYTDRLKRSPQQVLRHAHGGTPLWSIPIVSLEQQQNERTKRGEKHRNHQNSPAKSRRSSSQHLSGMEQDVPPCTACGASREFEFQLVPPLLHVLQVDKYAPDETQGGNSSKSDAGGSLVYYQQGGMDWGNIAVYACSNPACCDGPQEEFCVIQDSIDERFPSSASNRPQRHMAQGAAVIPEDSKFEDEDDDDYDSNADLEEGDFDDDDDDDDESW